MKTLLIIGLIAASFVVSPSARAEERTKEEVAAARAFKIEGVRLGMSKAEFLRLFPNANKLASITEEATGTLGFRVDSTSKTDGIDASFWNDKLIEMYIYYSPERTNKMGGDMTLVNRLVKVFGKGDADSKVSVGDEAQIKWKIEEANFYCEIFIKPNITTINLTDIKAYTERNKQKAKEADPGF